MINIGQVTGNYVFDEGQPTYAQTRAVKWIKHIPRTAFSQGALYEIGSAMAFFTVKNYTDEFLDSLEKGFKGKATAAVDDDETIGVFKPSTIEYERKCGFNDGSAVVDCGKVGKTYSIYGYVGFIMSYLFGNPLIKHWGSIFREEDELRTIMQSEINSESDV